MHLANALATLGLGQGADVDAVKAAWRREAKRLYPGADRNEPAARAGFERASAAYRTAHDAARKAAVEAARRRTETGIDAPDDAVASVLRAAALRPRRVPARGEDVTLSRELTVEEVVADAPVTLSFETACRCGRCAGKDGAASSGPAACPACRGAGALAGESGCLSVKLTCGSCDGTGRAPPPACPECGGAGVVRRRRTERLTRPRGASAWTIRRNGAGGAGIAGGPNGDLVVELRLVPHPAFAPDGDDLRSELRVSLRTAVFGAMVEACMPEGGRVPVVVPAGVGQGREIRLVGRGLPRAAGAGRGDLVLTVAVDLPARLSPEQERLFHRFAESLEGRRKAA